MPAPPITTTEFLADGQLTIHAWVGGRRDGPSIVEVWSMADEDMGAWQVWARPATPNKVVDCDFLQPPYRVVSGNGTIKQNNKLVRTALTGGC